MKKVVKVTQLERSSFRIQLYIRFWLPSQFKPMPLSSFEGSCLEKSQGQRSLVCYCLWGRAELDTT